MSGFATRLALIRWLPIPEGCKTELDSPLKTEDLVVMTKEEAAVHEEKVLKGETKVEELYSPAVLEKVERFKREEALFRVYR